MQIVINGRLLNYSEVNPKGKTDLIILHGWAHTGSLWQNLAQKLDKSIHCYLLDLPTFGSSQSLHGNPGVPEYTTTIVDFIKKLDLKQPSLLGHSFGGQIALDLAVKHPNLLSRLILISPAGIRRDTIKSSLVKSLFKILKPIKQLAPTDLMTKLSNRLFPDYSQANPAQKIVLNNILKYDLSEKLQNIEVPTKIIWGSQDHEIPYMGKFMTMAIPDCRLYVIYNAGHNPHLTHTDKLAQIINSTNFND